MRNGFHVEVIVMVVGDDDVIDGRQLGQWNGRFLKTLHREGNGRGGFGKTGSTNTTAPFMANKKLECPNQMTLRVPSWF